VFVYQIESYRYWQKELKRDDFTYGQFGENFTVQGLADDQVCIGDRYQIGEAVFEVTQPRVTCFRVGIRMDDAQMPALLVSHHRPGFYFRVLTEGTAEAGQEIIKLASGPEGMTVAEMDALLYLPGHPRQQLLRALRIPALSPGWKASFQEMLDPSGSASGSASGNAGLAEASPPPAWPGFRPFTVTRIGQESETVISLHLADPDGGNVPGAQPGQFLTVRLQPDPAGPALLRSYSLSGAPGAPGYRISVKRADHGAASRFLHDRVRVGDRLEAAAPRGTFTLRPGAGPVLLISAGVGATPVLAMLHALAAARSGRDIWWLHSARSRADEPFAAESRALLAALPNAHRHICYSHPGPDDVQGRDYDTAGRLSIDQELMDEVRSVRADAHYTKVHDGTRERMCPWSISEAEAHLDPGLFLRVHRSHIVAISHVTFVRKEGDGAVIELDGPAPHRVPVSRAKIAEVKARLGLAHRTV